MKLGIIGGSGLYNIESLEIIKSINIETPFGAPSDAVVHGKINNNEVFFMPRHGEGHRIAPHEINHKANIFAMKKLGITHILSISAVGSLKHELAPKDIVMIDQFYDRTKQCGEYTFFGEGIVAHIPFADPICSGFKSFVHELSVSVMEEVYSGDKPPRSVDGGTYVNIGGPAFSTKAESETYRKLGFDVIGMTSLGEAKLAREAEICYCTAAMVTDYDCWHPDHDSVSVEMVVNTMKANTCAAKLLIRKTAENFKKVKRDCDCAEALKFSIMTDPQFIPGEKSKDLKPLINKYI
ncbi:MAG: hypothetical protein K9L78_03290 [Victivallales bacterium]|nr:hypothetical protein [Victivallales bacterium]MCF7889123.1 hypothetical protein [Victivallales bacterium]